MATTTAASALLASMAKSAPKKTSGSKPKEGISNDALNSAIDKWIEADKEVRKWDGIKTTLHAQITGFAKPARLEACRSAGKVESTVTVNGRLNFSQKCQYSKIPAEHQEELTKAFGFKDAANYFKLRTTLSLKPEAVEDAELLGKLIEVLGEDGFAKAFTALQHLEVTETFHADYTLKPAVEKKAQPFLDSEVIKPYSPTLALPKGKKGE